MTIQFGDIIVYQDNSTLENRTFVRVESTRVNQDLKYESQILKSNLCQGCLISTPHTILGVVSNDSIESVMKSLAELKGCKLPV